MLNFPTTIVAKDTKKSTISQHFATTSCVSCNESTRDGICVKCIKNPQASVCALYEKIRRWERTFCSIQKVCASCCGRFNETLCVSLDCPVLYRLVQTQREYEQIPFVRSMLAKINQSN